MTMDILFFLEGISNLLFIIVWVQFSVCRAEFFALLSLSSLHDECGIFVLMTKTVRKTQTNVEEVGVRQDIVCSL